MPYDKSRVIELEAQLFEIAAKDKDLKAKRKKVNKEFKDTYNEMMAEHYKHPFYKGLRITLFSLYGIGAALLVGATIISKREEAKLQEELQRAAELQNAQTVNSQDWEPLTDELRDPTF